MRNRIARLSAAVTTKTSLAVMSASALALAILAILPHMSYG